MTVAEPPAPPKTPEHNRTGLDFRRPMPRPKVNGIVIDFHCHLLAHRHAVAWFESARHYGIDAFVTMTPLEEALGIQRDFPGKVQFIVVPKWQEIATATLSQWLDRGKGVASVRAFPGHAGRGEHSGVGVVA